MTIREVQVRNLGKRASGRSRADFVLRIGESEIIENSREISRMLEGVLNLSSIDQVFIRRESESDNVLVSFISDEFSEPLTYAFPDRHSAIVFFRFAWDLIGEFLDESRDFRSG